MPHMKKIIGNGQHTSLWLDPWLMQGRVVDLLGRNNWTVSDHRVSSIIHHNQWHMTLPELSHIWHLVLETDMNENEEDTWQWTASSDGVFSFCSAWQIASGGPMQVFNLYSVVWFPSLS